jgi:DnaJ-class molecular chaperone
VLLDPSNQVSTPWGGNDRGPCEKCSGEGRVGHRCLSCLETDEPDPNCVACRGRVEWLDCCPSCEGSAVITRIERRGISCFPTASGLHRYLRERDADLSGDVFVELEGKLSPDRDLDADEGAILVFPKRILDRLPASIG